jgi:hypothetical protein
MAATQAHAHVAAASSMRPVFSVDLDVNHPKITVWHLRLRNGREVGRWKMRAYNTPWLINLLDRFSLIVTYEVPPDLTQRVMKRINDESAGA